jgi:hypothetical protein
MIHFVEQTKARRLALAQTAASKSGRAREISWIATKDLRSLKVPRPVSRHHELLSDKWEPRP